MHFFRERSPLKKNVKSNSALKEMNLSGERERERTRVNKEEKEEDYIKNHPSFWENPHTYLEWVCWLMSCNEERR